MTEVRLKGENWLLSYSVFIPYEINHDFFMKSHMKLKDLGAKLTGPGIVGPDWGKGWILEGEQIKKYIDCCKYYIENIDKIINLQSLPENIGDYDDGYFEGFKASKSDNKYIESRVKSIEKQDIILLLMHLKEKALEAQKKEKALEFIGD